MQDIFPKLHTILENQQRRLSPRNADAPSLVPGDGGFNFHETRSSPQTYLQERFPNLRKYVFFRVLRPSLPHAAHYAPHRSVMSNAKAVPAEAMAVTLHSVLFVDTISEKATITN